MKHLFIFLFLLLFSLSSGQKDKQIIIEDDEAFLKEDAEWIKSLKKYDENSTNYNSALNLDTFHGRFLLLDANTNLNIDYNDVTYKYAKKYLSYTWYSKIIGLSAYYFPLFEGVFTKHGIPLELKYLAVVESALNPRAGSWAGAKGIWQFMPATGSEFGLYQNRYYSGFYDPVKSTEAAAKFLKQLYKNLGDWNLAISAYNCGEGNVRKAMARAGSKSYWKVRPYLPKETQAYVPSFIAVNYLFNFYKQHGMKPMYFKYSFYDVKMISTDQTISFNTFNKSYRDSDFFKFANPQFITNVIPKNSIVYVK